MCECVCEDHQERPEEHLLSALQFQVWGTGFTGWDSGFRVQGLGIGEQGLGFKV